MEPADLRLRTLRVALFVIAVALAEAAVGGLAPVGPATGGAHAAPAAEDGTTKLLVSQADTLVAASSDSASSGTDVGSAVIFPSVQGANLEGQKYALPGDFEGRCNLLFIAFKREQQAMVDTWIPAARYLASTYPELRYYELPTIKPLNAMTRWFINRGMRGGIPDPAARAATITLYIDKKPFREALRIQSEETITILLLDEGGRVLWRSEGPRTDETTQELNQAVRRAMPAPGEPRGGPEP